MTISTPQQLMLALLLTVVASPLVAPAAFGQGASPVPGPPSGAMGAAAVAKVRQALEAAEQRVHGSAEEASGSVAKLDARSADAEQAMAEAARQAEQQPSPEQLELLRQVQQRRHAEALARQRRQLNVQVPQQLIDFARRAREAASRPFGDAGEPQHEGLSQIWDGQSAHATAADGSQGIGTNFFGTARPLPPRGFRPGNVPDIDPEVLNRQRRDAAESARANCEQADALYQQANENDAAVARHDQRLVELRQIEAAKWAAANEASFALQKQQNTALPYLNAADTAKREWEAARQADANARAAVHSRYDGQIADLERRINDLHTQMNADPTAFYDSHKADCEVTNRSIQGDREIIEYYYRPEVTMLENLDSLKRSRASELEQVDWNSTVAAAEQRYLQRNGEAQPYRERVARAQSAADAARAAAEDATANVRAIEEERQRLLNESAVLRDNAGQCLENADDAIDLLNRMRDALDKAKQLYDEAIDRLDTYIQKWRSGSDD